MKPSTTNDATNLLRVVQWIDPFKTRGRGSRTGRWDWHIRLSRRDHRPEEVQGAMGHGNLGKG
jgi:hypothetical protein